MTLSSRKRFAILNRDNFTCRYCGRGAPDVMLEVDHIFPRAAGGDDRDANLVTACRDCNQGKRDSVIDPPEYREPLRPIFRAQPTGQLYAHETLPERLDRPVYYATEDWAVTPYGLERIDFNYYVGRRELDAVYIGKPGISFWLVHIGIRKSTDLEDLAAAMDWALYHHCPEATHLDLEASCAVVEEECGGKWERRRRRRIDAGWCVPVDPAAVKIWSKPEGIKFA